MSGGGSTARANLEDRVGAVRFWTGMKQRGEIGTKNKSAVSRNLIQDDKEIIRGVRGGEIPRETCIANTISDQITIDNHDKVLRAVHPLRHKSPKVGGRTVEDGAPCAECG